MAFFSQGDALALLICKAFSLNRQTKNS